MHALELKFRDALAVIQQPPNSYYQGDKQVFYLTYRPVEVLAVKRLVPTLTALATHSGWGVQPLSLGQVVTDFFANDPARDFILEDEHLYQPLKAPKLFAEQGAGLRQQRAVEAAVLAAQAAIADTPRTLLLLTDLECLHPYARFGPIEQHLYAHLTVPVVVLYPGRLSGSSLEFLDVYPPDGGYRSTHL